MAIFPRTPATIKPEAFTAPVISIGRIVHYVSHGTPVREDGTQAYRSECRAAIITAVWYSDAELTRPNAAVDLCVLNPTGMFFAPEVKRDVTGEGGGTWHWPERT